MKNKRSEGFTLVELLIVIVIIALISVVATASFSGVKTAANDVKKRLDVEAISRTFETNYNGQYQVLSGSQFGSGSIPTAPDGSKYTCVVGPDLSGDLNLPCNTTQADTFRVCAPLGTYTGVCRSASSSCFCIDSSLGTALGSADAVFSASFTPFGPVTGFTPATSGFGYSVAPTVTISGGGGSGATATATVNSNGSISLNLTSGGSGYSSQPQVLLSDSSTPPPPPPPPPPPGPACPPIPPAPAPGSCPAAIPAHPSYPDWTITAVCKTPINDLGTGSYQGFQAGLYPGGLNTVSASYLSAGMTAAAKIKPLALDGTPSGSGKIVWISVGMSNTNVESNQFRVNEGSDTAKNPQVVIVDGAQSGVDAEVMADTDPKYDIGYAGYWNPGTGYLDQQLSTAQGGAVTRKQVQVVWLKQALAGPASFGAFPASATRLKNDEQTIINKLISIFPNLQIIYVSSRIYAGYATSLPANALNPEPYAYESGFAVKWLIEDKINSSPTTNPWIAWGPYMWADGLRPRNDGVTWTCNELSPSDGTHPSNPTGYNKVANQLTTFFKTDSTAKSWFCKAPVSTNCP